MAAIAETGSISKAAVVLDLPQPSLTTQLRRIEKAVGGDLFVRSSAGVAPTALGDRLIPMLADLARHVDELMAEAAAAATPVLRFGIAEWTPATLNDAIRASLPSLDVQTETIDSTAAIDALGSGALAAAMIMTGYPGAAPMPSPSVSRQSVLREPVLLALPPDHPLAGAPTVTSAQLTSLSWVRHTREHWFHEVEEQFFVRFGAQAPDVQHYVGGHAEAMSWVRDAGTAALISPIGASPGVRLVRVQDAPWVNLVLVWRREAIAARPLAELLHTLRQYYCDYARTIPHYWSWMLRNPGEYHELASLLPPAGSGVRGVYLASSGGRSI